ncbi:DUF3368 domain-containing protein [Spirochaetia bacterium]|nr:DUF3368 domain-containing protein [Spirochaetia bacterium]
MIIIADTGPIISLAIIDKLNLLSELYGEIYIPNAVWEELIKYADVLNVPKVKQFKNNIRYINSENYLSNIMDDGESEAVILYKEMNADSFLVDDKHARDIAESLNVTCIGTLATLIDAKRSGLIKEIRPYFQKLIENDRYFSTNLLNDILIKNNEKII